LTEEDVPRWQKGNLGEPSPRSTTTAPHAQHEGRLMILFRRLLGDVLREHRRSQGRTLRDVSAGARVSLGYVSEIERGQKEASSECLAAICAALNVPLSVVMAEVSHELAREEASMAALTALRLPSRRHHVQADVTNVAA
jgi:XRE family transcriptional regulator, stress-response regulator